MKKQRILKEEDVQRIVDSVQSADELEVAPIQKRALHSIRTMRNETIRQFYGSVSLDDPDLRELEARIVTLELCDAKGNAKEIDILKLKKVEIFREKYNEILEEKLGSFIDMEREENLPTV